MNAVQVLRGFARRHDGIDPTNAHLTTAGVSKECIGAGDVDE
jgi:hypothetical protein